MRASISLIVPVLAALLAGSSAVASGPAVPLNEQAARKLYLTKCSKCHKMYDPADYSDPKWDRLMAKMSKKAKLTPEQERELVAYIQEQLRSARPTGKSTKAGK